MQGHFTVSLIDAQGLKDEDFLRACANGRLKDLLSQLPLLERVEGKNLVNDNFAGYIFYHALSGGDISDPYDFNPGGNGCLATILLSGDTADPTYTEASYSSYVTMHNLPGSVNTGSAGKRFIEDDVDTPELMVLPSGQEGIVFRSRFLYLPYEATCSTYGISSISVFESETANDVSSSRRGIIARVRLKNSAGTKITLGKSSKQVLLVEYEFTLLCV